MESNDLKPTPPDDAQLEAWLRTNASLPPLRDDGFSARVIANLPPPLNHRAWGRVVACALGALVGGTVALLQFQQGATLPTADKALLAALERFSDPAISLAAGVTLCTLAHVFWQDLRRFVRV